MYDSINHCLHCSDEDFCSHCFYRLQYGDLYLPRQDRQDKCSKNHKFLSVPRRVSGVDHVFTSDSEGRVDVDGTIFEVWARKLADYFIEKRNEEGDLWMKCSRGN